MKNKILLEVIIILAVIYGFIGSSKKEETSFFYPSANIKVKDVNTNNIDTLNVEEYLIGVLAGEMPASFEMEALKAQAVAARTYAYYKIATSKEDYDLTSDTTSQMHINEDAMKEKWQEDYDYYLKRIKDAILETKDEVLTYNGNIISSYYYSMSNGYTEDAKFVFGENKDYLKSVISSEDTSNKNFEVTKIMSQNDFCSSLNIDCTLGINISNIKITPAKRVDYLTINDKEFKGTEIRKLLDLRSTDFNIALDNDVYITTKGYGHGVGMSQYGAQTMAKEGVKYDQILKHYYTDVEIKNINSIK